MSCLIDSVGIRLCGDESLYYVDDIAGISVNLVQAIQPDKKQSFPAHFNQIKTAAYSQFLTEVELKFSGEKSFNHIISETPPFSSDKAHYLNATTDVLEGFTVLLPTHEFVEYHIKNLNFVAHKAGSVILKVIDLISSSVIYTQEISLTLGKNVVPINFTVTDPEKELFVAIQNIDAVLVSVLCGEAGCTSSCMSGCESICECSSGYGSIELGKSYALDNIEDTTRKFFCVDAQVRCNFETMICNYPEFFLNAFTHFFAIRILDDKINSYERGWYSDANVQTVIETTLPSTYKKFNQLLDLSLTNLYKLTNDSVCWSCNSRLQTKPSLHSLV